MLEKEKLTQQELDKLEIDPNIDFREIAKRPFEQISKNEIGMFKWSGVYHQLQTGYFMLRLRIPGGIFNSIQLRKAAELSKQYGQNQLCITTRQCLQYHWLRKEDIYKVIEEMKNVGILTTNACGDVVRNVTSCVGMGKCPYEKGNTERLVKKIADDRLYLVEKRNLPRKHKITVSGCNSSCGFNLINCQSWAPAEQNSGNKCSEPGWIYYAGGGLGKNPYMAKKIFDYVPESLVPQVTAAGVEVHNLYGDRRIRSKARLKIIVDKYGHAGYAKLIFDILKKDGVSNLDKIIISENSNPEIQLDPFKGQSVLPEKNKELNTIRVMIDRSELSSEEALFFADLSDKYGDGTITFSQRQNLQINGVNTNNISKLTEKINLFGYRTTGFEHLPDVVSCVGTTVCNLAVADTPNAYKMIKETLAKNEQFVKAIGPLRININGCPNACAHHWTADIGLRGRRLMVEEGCSEEAFSIYIGGKMHDKGKIGELLCDVPFKNLIPVLNAILNVYMNYRVTSKELFCDFCERITVDKFKNYLEHEKIACPSGFTSLENVSLNDNFNKIVSEAGENGYSR